MFLLKQRLLKKTRVKFTHWLWRYAVRTGLTSVHRTFLLHITFHTMGPDIRQFMGMWLVHNKLRVCCGLIYCCLYSWLLDFPTKGFLIPPPQTVSLHPIQKSLLSRVNMLPLCATLLKHPAQLLCSTGQVAVESFSRTYNCYTLP